MLGLRARAACGSGPALTVTSSETGSAALAALDRVVTWSSTSGSGRRCQYAWELRAAFARRAGRHVRARRCRRTTTLVEVTRQVNADVLAPRTACGAERLGSIDRVTAERHGAIRVGTPRELRAGGAGVRRARHAPGRLLRPARRGGQLACRSCRRRSVRSTRTSWRATRSGCSPRCSSPTTGASSTTDAPGPAATRSSRDRHAVRPRAARPGRPGGRRRRPARRGRGRVPADRRRRAFELSSEPGRPGLVRPAGRHLGVAADIGGVPTDAHQPPHAAGARHRRAVPRGWRAAASR